MKIGEPRWVDDLMELTRPLGAGFWARFRLASKQELAALEAAIGRRLPDEFHEFYRSVGYGRFEPGGRINSPSEILEMLGCAIWYSIGSLTPGQEWVTQDAHVRLWKSRAADNPAPERFTVQKLRLGEVALYDLLYVADDGCCGYHHLYVGPQPAPFELCYLYDGKIRWQSPSFSAGIVELLRFYLEDVDQSQP